jgi:hypothetical protein
MLLSARTFEELYDGLRRLNVEVPAHPAPRGDTPELYSIVRLLGTIPLAPGDLPLQLAKRERPDFVLQLDGRTVGIEHTEAVPENTAHESRLRAALGGGCHLVTPAVVGEPRKSRKQLLREIEENRFPPPMVGDSVERRWAEAMTHFIGRKVASAQKPGYAAYDEQWLAIYDNWPSFALERQHALALLQEHLAAADPFDVFDRVFILTGQVLVELVRGRTLLHRLNHCLPA